jgi:hypothetical protein
MTRTFHKTIIFTKVPLKKYFRYEDMFQVYPLNMDKMPYSNLQSHYPVVLEYWTSPKEKIEVEVEYENLKESFSKTATTITKQDKILSLLSLFTNHIFFRYNNFEGTWGLPILYDNPGEEADLWSTKWIMTGNYIWPEMTGQFQIAEFSVPKLQEVEFSSYRSYYWDNPNLDNDHLKEIVFPEFIFIGLGVYFTLPEDVREMVDSAISYSISAMEMKNSKKTLSLLASFTSVETMVNLEFRDLVPEKCNECGQLKFSISKKYRDYLLKYLGDTPANKKKFNAYYQLRSKIVHTGERLKTENLYHNLPKEDNEKEFITRIEILQLGKLSIINWLIKNADVTLKYEN